MFRRRTRATLSSPCPRPGLGSRSTTLFVIPSTHVDQRAGAKLLIIILFQGPRGPRTRTPRSFPFNHVHRMEYDFRTVTDLLRPCFAPRIRRKILPEGLLTSTIVLYKNIFFGIILNRPRVAIEFFQESSFRFCEITLFLLFFFFYSIPSTTFQRVITYKAFSIDTNRRSVLKRSPVKSGEVSVIHAH